MRPSHFIKVSILLALLLAACQGGASTAVSSPTNSVPEILIEGTSTRVSATSISPISTPDANEISPVLRLINLGKSVGQTKYSTDGKWLYVSSTTGVYAYDTTSYQEIRQVSSLPMGTLSPDGEIIVTWKGTSLYAVDGVQKPVDLEPLPGLITQPVLTSRVFSSDSSLIAQHYYDGTGNWFAIWRTTDGKLINTFKAEYMKISTDNRLVIAERAIQDTPGQESSPHVILYDLQTGEQLGNWLGEHPTFLSDNSLVMESDGYVYLFDSESHIMRHRFTGKFAAFSSDEQIVALLSNDRIKLYQVADGKLLRNLEVELSSIDRADLSFSADGQTLAGLTIDMQCCSGHSDNLSLWRVGDGSLIKTLGPSSFIFSPDGQTILTGNQVLQASDGSLVAELPPSFISSVNNLAFTPDGQQIIVASYDNLYLYPVAGKSIWIPEAGDPETYLPILKAASPHSVFGLPFDGLPLEEIYSPDGRFLAKNNQGIVTIWNTSGQGGSFTVPAEPEAVALSFPTNGQRVTRVAFSDDGRLAAFGLRAGSVELWDLNSKQKVFTIPPLVDLFNFVGGLAFSPDGKLLAIGSEDGIVRLYEINAK